MTAAAAAAAAAYTLGCGSHSACYIKGEIYFPQINQGWNLLSRKWLSADWRTLEKNLTLSPFFATTTVVLDRKKPDIKSSGKAFGTFGNFR